MDIRGSRVNFGVKYLDSPALRDIVNDSLEKGKFDKINQARKNISKYDLQTRLKVDLCYTDDYPTIIFSRYQPRKDVPVALSMDDYELTAITEFVSNKKENILKFARTKMYKMGNGAPNNKTYKAVVKDKQKDFKPPVYDVFG